MKTLCVHKKSEIGNHRSVSKKTSSNEREGLQELIAAAADWLDSADFEIPIGSKSNSLYTHPIPLNLKSDSECFSIKNQFN